MLSSALLLFPLVALVGLAIGLTALGGFLIVPAMAHLWPLPIDQAIATTLFATAPTPVLMLALFRRQGLPITAGAPEMLVFGAVGGLAGGATVSLLSAEALSLLLALVVISASLLGLFEVGAWIARRRAARHAPKAFDANAGADLVADPPAFGSAARRSVALGSAALSAMTGAGGPVVSIPLMLAIGVEVRRAIIASQWMMMAGTLSATAVLLAEGRVHVGLGLGVCLLTLAGVALGMRLARNLASASYRRVVGLTGLVTGLWLLVRSL